MYTWSEWCSVAPGMVALGGGGAGLTDTSSNGHGVRFMMHESAIDHRTDTRFGRTNRGRDAPVPSAAINEVLPPGWIGLQDCDISGVPGRAVPLHFVLLHPEIGAALLDIAPAATQGAEATLRRRLDAARFEGIFPGHLPVAHLRIAPEETGSLNDLLDQAFATLPPLSVAGGDAWVGVVLRALSPRDPSRGATYRGMSFPEVARGDMRQDMHQDMRQEEGRHGQPGRPRSMAVPKAAGLSEGWDGEAPDEAGPAGELPSHRRRPLVWVGAGAAGLATLAAVALLALGRPSVEAEPPLGGPATGSSRYSAVAPDLPAAPASRVTAGPALTGTTPAGSAPASSASANPNQASLNQAGPVLASPSPVGPTSASPTQPPSGGTMAVRTPEAASPRPEPPGSRGALAGANAPGRPAEMPAAPPNEAGRVVVTAAVNLRSGPAKTFAVLRTVPRGQVFRVHDRAPGNWVQVGEAQPEGWLYGEMVRDARP